MRSPIARMRWRRSSRVQGGVAHGRAPDTAAGAGVRERVFVLAVMWRFTSVPMRKESPRGVPRLRTVAALEPALADGALLAQLGAAPGFAGLLVELALAQFLGEAAPLEQLLEAAQGGADRFAVVDAHPQRHASSFGDSRRDMRPGVVVRAAAHRYALGQLPRERPGGGGLVAAAAAAAAAVAAAAAAAAALGLGPGLVDGQGAAARLLAVQGGDGRLGLLVVLHLHEAEALGAARVAVHDHLGGLHRAVGLEQGGEFRVGHPVAQVADVQLLTHLRTPEKGPLTRRGGVRPGNETDTRAGRRPARRFQPAAGAGSGIGSFTI